jgi:hypothetical protein
MDRLQGERGRNKKITGWQVGSKRRCSDPNCGSCGMGGAEFAQRGRDLAGNKKKPNRERFGFS